MAKSTKKTAAGLNKAAARKTLNQINNYMTTLDSQLKKFKTDVEEMNKNCWYGGDTANSWYKNKAVKYYDNTLNYVKTKLVPMQDQLDRAVSKLEKI